MHDRRFDGPVDAAQRAIARNVAAGDSRPRTNGTGCSVKSLRLDLRRSAATRVATCTSNPAARAARAIGSGARGNTSPR
jgi:hypothetical protein